MARLIARWFGRAPRVEFGTRTALFSDVGPVREHNEDCIAALNQRLPGAAQERTALVALADGMGGHQAGETASRLAIDAALRSFDRAAGAPMAQRLHTALTVANEAVFHAAQQAPQWQGMGTTLALLALDDAAAFCAWVGDSRLYRWRAGAIEQLSRDDTMVMALLDRGLIEAKDVATHAEHSALTQAVGTREAIANPHVRGPFEIRIGDRFLLTSDGVHDVVDAASLALALGAPTPLEAQRAIHAQALQQRADDNLSIGVVFITEPLVPARAARSTVSEVGVEP